MHEKAARSAYLLGPALLVGVLVSAWAASEPASCAPNTSCVVWLVQCAAQGCRDRHAQQASVADCSSGRGDERPKYIRFAGGLGKSDSIAAQLWFSSLPC